MLIINHAAQQLCCTPLGQFSKTNNTCQPRWSTHRTTCILSVLISCWHDGRNARAKFRQLMLEKRPCWRVGVLLHLHGATSGPLPTKPRWALICGQLIESYEAAGKFNPNMQPFCSSFSADLPFTVKPWCPKSWTLNRSVRPYCDSENTFAACHLTGSPNPENTRLQAAANAGVIGNPQP